MSKDVLEVQRTLYSEVPVKRFGRKLRKLISEQSDYELGGLVIQALRMADSSNEFYLLEELFEAFTGEELETVVEQTKRR